MKHYQARHRAFALSDKIYGQDITVIVGEEELFQKWCKRNNIVYDQTRNYAEKPEKWRYQHTTFTTFIYPLSVIFQ